MRSLPRASTGSVVRATGRGVAGTDDRVRAISEVVASIPAGRVCAYGRVAEIAGLPRRARLVGRVLSELPAGHALPWHRVVRASGQLAFEPGSSGFRRQAQRLRAEGVLVAGGRIDMRRFGWQMSLDERLWGPRD